MKKKPKTCGCLDKAQKAAKPKGFRFVTKPMFNFTEQTFSMGGPFLLVEKSEKSRKPLPTVVCAYCPFCGKRNP